MKTQQIERIGLFISGYPFDQCCILASAELLNRAGFAIDLFHCSWGWGKAHSPKGLSWTIYDLNVSKQFLDSQQKGLIQSSKDKLRGVLPDWVRKFISKISYLAKKILHSTPRSIEESVISLFSKSTVDELENTIAKSRYRCFVGIESMGLIMAGLMGEKFKVPTIYYSLELYLKGDSRFWSRKWSLQKSLESYYHSRSVATIIQDAERSHLLMTDNKISDNRVFYVPVSLLGDPVRIKKKYFHKSLHLPEPAKVILQFGYIHEDRLCLETAKALQKLPDRWLAVFHGPAEEKTVQKMKKIDQAGKLYFSRNLVDREKLPIVMSSADIGLVFYRSDNVNDYNTGLSSEKMARHMQCGTPVITPNYPSFKRIVEHWRCGICVSDVSEIPDAVTTINSDYEKYSSNALQCYHDNYEFSKHFKSVLHFIQQDLKL